MEAAHRCGLGLILAGRDAGALQEIMRYVRRSGMRHFRYAGIVSEAEKNRLIDGALGVVVPSLLEGVPFVALEAASRGRPVICTNRSYVDNSYGFVMADPTVASLANAMTSLALDLGRRPIKSVPSSEAVVKGFLATLKAE